MATTINRLDSELLLYTQTGQPGCAVARRPFSAQLIADLIKPITRTEQLISLADRLVRVAESALDLHQTATVEQVSRALRHLPLPRRYESLAEFYRTFALRRRGALAEACAGFERLAETSTLPLAFRARSLQALALSHTEQDQWDDALYGFLQAARAATVSGDMLGQVNARWMLAVHYQSRMGDHAGALNVFEELMPFVRVLASEHPYIYYSMLNSRALELIELGRGDEALYLSSIAVRSSVADIHPEYRETQAEILEKMRRASPSVVGGVRWPQEPVAAIAPPVVASNVITLPLHARAVAPTAVAAPQQTARIIPYRGWQQPTNDSPEISPERFTPGDLGQMSIHDKQNALLTVIFDNDVSHDTLDRLLTCAGKIITDQTVG